MQHRSRDGVKNDPFKKTVWPFSSAGLRHLSDIVNEAGRRGLVVHVTTGQHHVPAALLDGLASGITGLQIGVKADRLLADPDAETAALARTASTAVERGLHVGANLILSRQRLPHFERLLDLLQQAELSRVTLLRYKPPADVAEWMRAKPSVEDIREFERRLPDVLGRRPEIDLRLDCALSFLQRHLASPEAIAQGVRGCVAGDRILAVTPDGSAFPCSQLVDPRFRAGNLLMDPLGELWTESKILRGYRSLRDKSKFRGSTCGLCAARDHCGGCRAFADDALGAEPECPEPRTPPRDQLGKAGRRWDLDRYLRDHGSMTKGFACDHSSTSYGFLAVDKPLDQQARRDVGALSSRANPAMAMKMRKQSATPNPATVCSNC